MKKLRFLSLILVSLTISLSAHTENTIIAKMGKNIVIYILSQDDVASRVFTSDKIRSEDLLEYGKVQPDTIPGLIKTLSKTAGNHLWFKEKRPADLFLVLTKEATETDLWSIIAVSAVFVFLIILGLAPLWATGNK
ncbi:MAG: hypothetical protein NTX66_03815 [Candidatus Falkowbacteria bacterium]|nr:hypothetical protein [Candidatus Falkowbacteria bacterium]